VSETTRNSEPLFTARLAAQPQAELLHIVLKPGDCLGITGPSGCGKSRLLRRLADLDPHDGEMRLDGVEFDRMPATDWRCRVGLLPADSQWWADRVGAHFASEPPVDWLSGVGLPAECLSWEAARLSSGERARLALLRLLVNRPRVLLLDEPCANLDSRSGLQVEKLVLDYLHDSGAAAIWVAHDDAQLARVASQRLSLDAHGQVAEAEQETQA
jgi:ABC-type iron transport system FetAB ATPase subunit